MPSSRRSRTRSAERALVEREKARRELLRRSWRSDPVKLMALMTGVDQRDGTRFSLSHLAEPLEPSEVRLERHAVHRTDRSWRWQRFVAERLLAENRMVLLKGRQIGVTWIVLAADVAECLTLEAETTSLMYRQREDDAIDNIRRWWILFCSLPEWVRKDITVLTPSRAGIRPGRSGISLRFANGAVSEILPMTSAASSGHGRSVRRVTLDEAAHIEKLEEIRAAVEPAVGDAAVVAVSTANGRSNPETGEGNEFHRLWEIADTAGYARLFLPYDVHPARDEAWYAQAPEVQSLRINKRQEQFPRDEHEAFMLSQRIFLDEEALIAYRERIRSPLERFQFRPEGAATARRVRRRDGLIRLFERPSKQKTYAIGVDVASQSGRDFSAAYVIDLTSMGLVAELHGRLGYDEYAEQLHFLGRWFGRSSGCAHDALLGIETQGGYGDAVIVALRDGTAGRPAYSRIEHNQLETRSDKALAKPWGIPMGMHNRPRIVGGLEAAVRERALPWVTNDLLHEMESFVEFDVGLSPRAQDGAHDDRVLACAIAVELYRRHGHHEFKVRRRSRRTETQPYPWVRPRRRRSRRAA
jgi:hypothetical protein